MHPLSIYAMTQLDVAERLAQAETERQVLRMRRARRAAHRAARAVPVAVPLSVSDAGARHRLLAGLAARAAGERAAGDAVARARGAFGAPAGGVLPDGTIGCRA